MTTFLTLFPDERSAQHFIQQLALETSVSAITFLQEQGQNDHYSEPLLQNEALLQHGFTSETFNCCRESMNQGGIAVLIEGSDAADMLTALHEYGVQHYHMA